MNGRCFRSWRTCLLAAALSVALLPTQSSANRPLNAAQPLPSFLSGGDISLLPLEEQHGLIYKDHGVPRDALAIFKDSGYNCMRLRLWVHPSGEGIFVNDLPYTVALGRRIKKAGFRLILDIHYSDTWADPGKQGKPAAWAALPFDKLTTTVHDYTRDVVEQMRKGGAMPDIIQIGNEITGGMLWPDGKDWGPGHDFVNLSKLLKAGIAGVFDASKGVARPLIMIHIDKGGDWGGTKWFFDGIIAQGVDFDIIGESFCPFFQGPLSQLKNTLTQAADRYHKPIIVAETGYAYEDDGRGPHDGVTYPKTPDGQKQFLMDLMATVRATPDGLGRGIIYWAPEWVPGDGIGGWDGTTLFDESGNALPGLDALGLSNPSGGAAQPK
jgi:arabinogalactan endo-1,4-beta-galactosidase